MSGCGVTACTGGVGTPQLINWQFSRSSVAPKATSDRSTYTTIQHCKNLYCEWVYNNAKTPVERLKKSQISEIRAPQLRQPCVNRAKSHTSRTLGIYWDRIQWTGKRKPDWFQRSIHKTAPKMAPHRSRRFLQAQRRIESNMAPLQKVLSWQNFWEKGFLTHRAHHLN